MSNILCPDYFSTSFNPQGEPMPPGSYIVRIVQGEAELGLLMYQPDNRVAVGQSIRYAGRPFKVVAEEVRGGVYEVRVARGTK